MRSLFVMGHPVEHSLSPAMFAAAFRALHLEGEYDYGRWDVAEPTLLAEAMGKVRGAKVLGLSVTMPLKEEIMSHLDVLTEESALVRAVNTVVSIGYGEYAGYNTDGNGCVDALQGGGADVGGARVAILGAGGAARSAAFALLKNGSCGVRMAARTPAKADRFAAGLREVGCGEVTVFGWCDLSKVVQGADILINATPVGMTGYPPGPLVRDELITGEMTVMDMVSNPAETSLIAHARRVGAKAIPGTEMLLHQGARQFKLFTGMEAPIAEMREAVCEATGTRHGEGGGR